MKFKKLIALLLTVFCLMTAGIVTTSAIDEAAQEQPIQETTEVVTPKKEKKQRKNKKKKNKKKCTCNCDCCKKRRKRKKKKNRRKAKTTEVVEQVAPVAAEVADTDKISE